MNAKEIVKKLRDYDEEIFNYKLPDIYDQVIFIQEQLDAGIKIFVVNAPVISTTDKTVIISDFKNSVLYFNECPAKNIK